MSTPLGSFPEHSSSLEQSGLSSRIWHGQGKVGQASLMQSYSSPPFPPVFLMEVLLCSPHVRSRELSSLCQREEYLHWLFAILLPGRLASSLPCIYVLTRLFLLACIICFFNLCSHSTYHSLALSKFSLVFVERMRRRVIERTANLCCLQIQMLKP